MRTILIGDIIAAARSLLAVRDDCRVGMIAVMLDEAHAAHAFHKRMGRPHFDWGNGSLLARANKCQLLIEPFASDANYLRCLEVVIAALLHRRATIISQ